jgi:hypothetical protein
MMQLLLNVLILLLLRLMSMSAWMHLCSEREHKSHPQVQHMTATAAAVVTHILRGAS